MEFFQILINNNQLVNNKEKRPICEFFAIPTKLFSQNDFNLCLMSHYVEFCLTMLQEYITKKNWNKNLFNHQNHNKYVPTLLYGQNLNWSDLLVLFFARLIQFAYVDIVKKLLEWVPKGTDDFFHNQASYT